MKEKETSTETTENTAKVEKKKKVLLPVIIAVVATVAVIIAVVIIGRTAYFYSNGYRGQMALALGNQYLGNQDYENALIEFRNAYDLANSPENVLVELEKKIGISFNNAKIVEDVSYGILTIEDVALKYGNQGDFTSEAELIELILKFFPEDEKAIEIKDEVDAFGKLLDLCEASDWEEVLAYLDSDTSTSVKKRLEKECPVLAKRNVTLTIGESESVYYVITQEADATAGEGNGVGVFSATKTYSVYEGQWKDGAPYGIGVLNIWFKNSDRNSGCTYTGNFHEGKANFTINVESNDIPDLRLKVNDGNVYTASSVNGIAFLLEPKNGWGYAVKNYSSFGEVIDGFSLGIPGFGASDDCLVCEYVFSEDNPPVFTFDTSFLKKGRYIHLAGDDYEDWDEFIGERLTAYDEVDGDVTDRIKCDSKQHEHSYDWAVDATYSVTDSSGNKATMLISFVYGLGCQEIWMYNWKYEYK